MVTKKIGWTHIFLLEAILWSKKSNDPYTKCGCVLVKNKTVLSTGYNGFIREIDDTVLPLTRPDKNKFFIHAEHNAILNCAKNGVSTDGATAYITGEPCNWCLQYMYQAGIVSIIYTDWSKPQMCATQEFQDDKEKIVRLIGSRMKMEFVSFEKELKKYVRSKK